MRSVQCCTTIIKLLNKLQIVCVSAVQRFNIDYLQPKFEFPIYKKYAIKRKNIKIIQKIHFQFDIVTIYFNYVALSSETKINRLILININILLPNYNVNFIFFLDNQYYKKPKTEWHISVISKLTIIPIFV